MNILEYYYYDKYFSFFVAVFDRLIYSKISLNINIDYWPPTLLCLVVNKASRKLFDYFIQKGAILNFVGDSMADLTEDEIKYESISDVKCRYKTCLDFAQLKLDDMMSTDYAYYNSPQSKELMRSWIDMPDKEELMTIKKEDYYYLLEQSMYLRELIETDKLISYIKHIGGKTYEELSEKI